MMKKYLFAIIVICRESKHFSALMEKGELTMIDREKIANELRFQLDSKEVKDQHYPVQLSASDANAILTLLKEQQQIVRCKDCKWWHESETHKGYGDCGQANGIILKSSDWFCADGERKDDDA